MNDIKHVSGKTRKTKRTTKKATPKRGVAASAKHVSVTPNATHTRQLTRRSWRQRLLRPRLQAITIVCSVSILLATTVVWSWLGAIVENGNADQLVNTYLMKRLVTFQGATLPGQHTFLVKWPLFLIIKLLGFTTHSFLSMTIAVAVATVGLFIVLLYRIERRPYVFSVLCLAFASVLLCIPAQPAAGALLPVNMAMLTTRNLEYILYLAGLVLFIRSPRVRSKQFWLGVLVMSLLIASDKLFMTLGIGAAAVSLFVYALFRRTTLVTFSAIWLFGELAATVIAIAGLWIINFSGLTHIANQSATSPYGVVSGTHGVVIGVLYVILGLLTNMGANPSFDALEVRQIVHQGVHRLFSLGGLGFVTNLALTAIGLFAMYRIVRANFIDRREDNDIMDRPKELSLAMIWSTLIACGVYVASNHYYAADARYLAISLFALFITAATMARTREWSTRTLFIAAVILIGAIASGVSFAVRDYQDEVHALSTVNGRNGDIATILGQHKVHVLIGDYWRVIPTRLAASNKFLVMPMQNCTQPRTVLSSKVWQPDLHTQGFAYLLSFDQKLTDYPICTLGQVTSVYGQPNATALIAGTQANPQEMLLFYDHGSEPTVARASTATEPTTVLPISPDELPDTHCAVPSTMNIVAHQDDDILFMNPDIMNDLKQGMCEQTIYVTAGDAGSGAYYWLGRQQGAEAAYAALLKIPNIWVQRIVRLATNEYVTVAVPRSDPRVSLIFMNIPDGDLNGVGYAASGNESLARLYATQIKSITTVERQSTYTSQELTAALTTLMHVYEPTGIRTQANYIGHIYPDHSDHMAVGRFVKQAYTAYELQQYNGQVVIPLKFYIGYPIHQLRPNVSDGNLAEKTAAFMAYAQHDSAVCVTQNPCKLQPVLTDYLAREYTNDY